MANPITIDKTGDNMNVVILSYYSGIISRGGESFVHELANSLIENDHDVTVYQGGEKLVGAKYKTLKLKNVYELPKFAENVDCVVPLNGRVQAVKSSIWCKTHRKKILISAQSGIGFDDRINAWTFPDALVCLSAFQLKWAKTVNPFIKIVRIPNGVNTDKFNSQVSPMIAKLQHPIVLCVAALVKEKQLDTLIHAVSKLNGVSLLLIGEGPERRRLELLGENLLADRFDIQVKQYSEMPKAYTACDVFAFPTVAQESFGIAMIEAMASGLPVVASNDPIRVEIVGNAGITASPKHVDEFSVAISDTIKKNWGTLPVTQAQKYSWKIIGKCYSDLIYSICQ